MPQVCTCSTDRSGTRLPWMYLLVLSSGIFQPPNHLTPGPIAWGQDQPRCKLCYFSILSSSFLTSSLLAFFSRFHPSDLFLQCSLRMSWDDARNWVKMNWEIPKFHLEAPWTSLPVHVGRYSKYQTSPDVDWLLPRVHCSFQICVPRFCGENTQRLLALAEVSFWPSFLHTLISNFQPSDILPVTLHACLLSNMPGLSNK